MRQSDSLQQLLELQASMRCLAREGDVRDRRPLDLQANIEGLTRWLVRLTTISASSASAGSGRRPGRR